MHIWVDADACPRPVKEILYRVAMKRSMRVTLVANQHLSCPRSPFIKALQVPGGFDVADNEIVARLTAGDLVITADIPLAAEIIAAGGHVITAHGERLGKDNMAERLQMRNLTETLRSSGMIEGSRQASFSATDKANFANALDRFLAQQKSA